MREGIEVIAHRGYSAQAPENTLAAVEAAIVAGADAIEFDLHVTADGVPVLFHDDTLERTTDGRGAIASKTYAELRGLDAGSWFAPDFAGEPIPTLDDAYALMADRVGQVYPEIKGHGGQPDLVRMVDIVVAHGMLHRTVFISMDWEALEQMRAHHASARIGYIVERSSRAAEGLERAAADPLALLDFKAALLLDDPGLVRRARDAGIDLAVWTVDSADEADALLTLGVRRITTNRVSELLAWKAAR